MYAHVEDNFYTIKNCRALTQAREMRPGGISCARDVSTTFVTSHTVHVKAGAWKVWMIPLQYHRLADVGLRTGYHCCQNKINNIIRIEGFRVSCFNKCIEMQTIILCFVKRLDYL